jgi:hypothetical protein
MSDNKRVTGNEEAAAAAEKAASEGVVFFTLTLSLHPDGEVVGSAYYEGNKLRGMDLSVEKIMECGIAAESFAKAAEGMLTAADLKTRLMLALMSDEQKENTRKEAVKGTDMPDGDDAVIPG